MSRDFIGSKIAIITRSQCRYVGTIIGIDAQTSSIILGNAKSFGTENRSGHSNNGHAAGTILPIVQFANSDIEDLKIVDDTQASETPQQQQQQQQSFSMPVVPTSPPSASSQQASIHDDPAIVSAVVSSSAKDNNTSSASSRLIQNLQHLSLSNEPLKTLPKNEESHIRTNSGELGPSWSLLSSSKWENNNNNHIQPTSSYQRSNNKSKFFDDFFSNGNNKTNQSPMNRSHQRPFNTHSTQTSRENDNQYDETGLPVRQPFFANDQSYPPKQQNRYQNGHNQYQYQQRSFYNNRRPQGPNQQRRMGGGIGGNRETFQDNPNDYANDFDFETSNQKFNKLTSEDDLTTDQSIQPEFDNDFSAEHPPSYDKKKSFFDNLALITGSDAPTSNMYNRSKNRDTFGTDAYHRQDNRSYGNGYRRSNNNNNTDYRQKQYGNEDFHYRQYNNNKNGYHSRY